MKQLIILILILLSLSSAYSITAYVQPAKIVIYGEVDKQTPKNHITIKNLNEYNVSVTITMETDIEHTISDTYFLNLKPDEERLIYFTFTPSDTGRYEIPISVNYEGNFSATVQSTIVLIAGNVTTTTVQTTTTSTTTTIITTTTQSSGQSIGTTILTTSSSTTITSSTTNTHLTTTTQQSITTTTIKGKEPEKNNYKYYIYIAVGLIVIGAGLWGLKLVRDSKLRKKEEQKLSEEGY